MENNMKYHIKRRNEMKTVDVIFVSDELVGSTIVSRKEYERLLRQKVKSDTVKSEDVPVVAEGGRTPKRKAPPDNDIAPKRTKYVDDVELALAALENDDDVERVAHALPTTLLDEEDVSAREMLSHQPRNRSRGAQPGDKVLPQTPNNLRKRVMKDMEEIQKILENSDDDDYPGSESDESFRLSDDSASESSPSEHSRSEKTFFESYCELRSSKKATPTGKKMKTPKLTREKLDELVGNFQMSAAHKNSVKNLFSQTVSLFSKWDFVLKQNYNLILYGAGSKREILRKFVERFIDVHPVIVVNGFFPGVSGKEILEKVCAILKIKMDSADPVERLRTEIARYDLRIYLAINNIDGIMLRSDRVQAMLSRLGNLEQVHIIASIDHINAPLIWNKGTCGELNWLWYDSTTFLSYAEETVYEGNLMLQSTGRATLASLRNVFNSLTKNSRGMFLVMARKQVESSGSGRKAEGISFRELYRECRKELLVSSDVGLRAQLKEFVDHLILKQKRNADGEEEFVIVVEGSILREFLEEQERREN